MKKLFIYAAFATLLLSCSSKDDPKPPVGSTGKYDFSAVDKFLMDHLSVYGNHVAILVSQNGAISSELYQQIRFSVLSIR